MALYPCPECGKDYSDKAQSCPHCGSPKSPTAEEVELNKKLDREEFLLSIANFIFGISGLAGLYYFITR